MSGLPRSIGSDDDRSSRSRSHARSSSRRRDRSLEQKVDELQSQVDFLRHKIEIQNNPLFGPHPESPVVASEPSSVASGVASEPVASELTLDQIKHYIDRMVVIVAGLVAARTIGMNEQAIREQILELYQDSDRIIIENVMLLVSIPTLLLMATRYFRIDAMIYATLRDTLARVIYTGYKAIRLCRRISCRGNYNKQGRRARRTRKCSRQ